jgi:di/tricarboxylate transporter
MRLLRPVIIALPALAILAAPFPADLPWRGQRALAVVLLAIALWSTEALPAGVTGLTVVVALILTGPGIGVLTWSEFGQGFGWRTCS